MGRCGEKLKPLAFAIICRKDIVGAVFDTESPLLKHLPESKSLSTLHFRIFKKGLEMPVKDFPPSALAAISEEQATCRAHLGERMTEKGGRRHIFAYGLALDQPLPESVAILDGLIDRARNTDAACVLGTCSLCKAVR